VRIDSAQIGIDENLGRQIRIAGGHCHALKR
jgi:hypothetical protein